MITLLKRMVRWQAGFLLLPAVLLWAVAASAQEYSFQVYDQSSGLQDPAVFCMEQAPDGALWFCTDHALYRFDGHNLQKYADKAFGDDLILGLKVDAQGNMWVNTGWLLLYGHPGAFSTVESIAAKAVVPLGASEALILVSGQILHVWRSGSSWMQSQYLRSGELQEHPEAGKLTSLVQDRDGTLWGSCERKICRIQKGSVTVWGDLPPEEWTAFLKDREGTVWARGQHRTAVLEGGQFRLRDNPDALRRQQDVDSASLVEDKDGRILSFAGDEVSSWDGVRWTNYRSGQYAGYPVTFVKTDRNGSVWIGRSAIGVLRWVGYGQTEHWTHATGLASNLIYAIARDRQNRVWVGSVGGIDVLQDGLVVKSYRDTNQQQTRSLVATADGSIWAGTSVGGLLRFRNGGDPVVVVHDIPHITSMFPDSRGNLWVCTWKGVYRLDTATGKIQKDALIPRQSESVYGGNEDAEGNLWFATAQRILRRSRDGVWTLLPSSGNAPLDGSFISTIDPHQRLWMSSFAGYLRRFQLTNGQLTDEQHIVSPSSHLRTHYILSHDRRGWVWFGTDQGIDIFNGSSWLHITEEDGLISNDTDVYAFLSDSDGTVWIGTSRGVTHFLEPEKLFREESLHAELRTAAFAGEAVNLSQPVPVRSGGALEVSFGVAEDPSPYNLQFRYRLVGLSDEWQSTHDRTVRFVGVPAGQYRFEIAAKHPGHGVISTAIGFDLTVHPPWWRSVWAYLTCAVLAVLGIVGLWRRRTAQLRRKQHELERVVAERTEELQREKQELIAAREELRERAERDGLTRLWNRQTILDILDRELERARRGKQPLTVVLADLDYFKRINDSFGHLAGDEVLRTVTARIQGWVRTYDSIGRFGGEELLLIFPGMDLQETAARLEDLRRTINQAPYAVAGQNIWVTCSFGVAEASPGMSRERVIHIADAALYQAKADGRDCIRIGRENG